MIEIIETFKENDHYFSIIDVPKNDRKERFRFGITQQTYRALKNILQGRLLDAMPGLKYRYFWDGSMAEKTESTILLGIRCEVEGNGKSFDFELSKDFASNLKWFSELVSFEDAEHFKVEP